MIVGWWLVFFFIFFGFWNFWKFWKVDFWIAEVLTIPNLRSRGLETKISLILEGLKFPWKIKWKSWKTYIFWGFRTIWRCSSNSWGQNTSIYKVWGQSERIGKIFKIWFFDFLPVLLSSSIRTRTPIPNPQSQSFSRCYGSILPTSLTYFVLWARGC